MLFDIVVIKMADAIKRQGSNLSLQIGMGVIYDFNIVVRWSSLAFWIDEHIVFMV